MPSDTLIGLVYPFAGNFAPRGHAFCEGQLLAIAGNSALFSILGTIYGGDGRTTFGLPDLRGRVAVQQGTGPGLSPVRLGEKAGAENVTVNVNQLPSHNHTADVSLAIQATTEEGNQTLPSATNRLAAAKLSLGQDVNLYSTAATDTTLGGLVLDGQTLDSTGGGTQQHTNIQPVLGIRYIIALVGIFPSRN